MAKKENVFLKHWKGLTALIVTVGIISGYVYSRNREEIEYRVFEVRKTDLRQEVSVTGRVVPIDSVNLGFEISGRVEAVLVDVGGRVKTGQELVRLNASTLRAQLSQAQSGVAGAQAQWQQLSAALETEQANLDDLKAGTRPEEIQVAQTAVLNAEIALEDAHRNLESVTKKTEADLDEVYQNALIVLSGAVNKARQALLTLTDIQYAHFLNFQPESVQLEQAKQSAVYALLGELNAGRWARQPLSELQGGLFGRVQSALQSPTRETIETALTDTLLALNAVKTALNTVTIKDSFSATERANMDIEKTNISAELVTVTNRQQSVAVQKISSQNSILTAQTSLNAAQNSLKTAGDQLSLKKAGATTDQVRSQEARVKQAQANLNAQAARIAQERARVQDIQSQLEKTVLRAPISGLVTRMRAKTGEIVLPTSQLSEDRTLISLISEGSFEIETNVAEVDISKIKIGDPATVTLDAYGSEVEFRSNVMMIDPAETVVEGVSTYKVTLIFEKEDDRVKSGMTANLDILTDSRQNVIAIPLRAVRDNDESETVRVLEMDAGTGNPFEVEKTVRTGMVASDGRVEITSGLNEGELVIISTENGS